MPDSNIKSKTCTGGIVTLILCIILLGYSVQNFIVLYNRSNYRILEQSKLRVLTHSEFSFGKKDGFTLAAAFVGRLRVEDPEIGQMKFMIKSWQKANEAVKFTELTQRACNAGDFVTAGDLGQNAYGFYPMSDSAKTIVNDDSYNLKCIVDDFDIAGNFNSDTASNLMVVFEICDSSQQTCKDEKAINEYL